MPNFSSATVMGHVTRNAEAKAVGEHLVASFSVAVSRKVKGQDEVTYFDCKAWDAKAEFVEKYFKKGSAVLVIGELVKESWQDRTTQEMKSKMVIVVDRCTFAGGAPSNRGGGSQGGGGGYQRRQRDEDRAQPGDVEGSDEIPF